MSIESVMPSNDLILCHPLFLLYSIFPGIRVFSNESLLHISFSISPSNEYSGLISFRMDLLDLLAVQETLKSLLQPQFKSTNSLALSIFYSLTLTSIHDYWENPAICIFASFCTGQIHKEESFNIPLLSLHLIPLFPHLFAMK